jgi:bifunctional UDP-N-acetylglucosamine pyrophosphorylase/glucosamine-1-phosphate N-acetyltransferase
MSQARPLEVVLLAAGQGKRMASRKPKVLQTLASRPMLFHVLDTLHALPAERIHVVVGHQADLVRQHTDREYHGQIPLNWVLQETQRGTGHAVQQALPDINPESQVLVVYGDVPLMSAEALRACLAALDNADVSLLTAQPADAAELGRIVRDDAGRVLRIVEYRDATPRERALREINTGILAATATTLSRHLAAITPHNAQGEFYLTDVIGLAVDARQRVHAEIMADAGEALGVNDRGQLATLERLYQQRAASRLLAAGLGLADPARIDLRGVLTHGLDCFLDVNVIIEGRVVLGDDVYVGPGAVLKNAVLGNGARVEAYTLVDGAELGEEAVVGPFARIRPGTRLGSGVRIGNFVETKKTVMGPGSKANHLTYLGDATVGADCNVGAGTVTCNYDGIDKHPTTIGDRVFVGTNSTLVAPIEIASDAFVAAGSTVTTRIGQGDLAVGRSRQRNIRGWVRPDRRRPPEDKSSSGEHG